MQSAAIRGNQRASYQNSSQPWAEAYTSSTARTAVRAAIVTLCERRQREGRGHAEGKAEAKQREGRCDLTVLILGAVALMREAISMQSGASSPCSYWVRSR